MIGWVNQMNKNSNLTDGVKVETKRVESISAFLKCHKIITTILIMSLSTIFLTGILDIMGVFDKYEGVEKFATNTLIPLGFVTSAIILIALMLMSIDNEYIYVNKHTLDESKVAYLNDVLIFLSEPRTLYRRNYFINLHETDSEMIKMIYPEKPLRIVKSNAPKDAEEDEMLRMTQSEEKSMKDILKLYDTIVTSKQAIQKHEDSKIHQRVREKYNIHQTSSHEGGYANPTLNSLIEQLEQVDDDIKLEIQQKLNDTQRTLKESRKK